MASNGFSAREGRKLEGYGVGYRAVSSAARLSCSVSRLIFQNAFGSAKPASGSLPSISESSPAFSPCNRLPLAREPKRVLRTRLGHPAHPNPGPVSRLAPLDAQADEGVLRQRG